MIFQKKWFRAILAVLVFVVIATVVGVMLAEGQAALGESGRVGMIFFLLFGILEFVLYIVMDLLNFESSSRILAFVRKVLFIILLVATVVLSLFATFVCMTYYLNDNKVITGVSSWAYSTMNAAGLAFPVAIILFASKEDARAFQPFVPLVALGGSYLVMSLISFVGNWVEFFQIWVGLIINVIAAIGTIVYFVKSGLPCSSEGGSGRGRGRRSSSSSRGSSSGSSYGSSSSRGGSVTESEVESYMHSIAKGESGIEGVSYAVEVEFRVRVTVSGGNINFRISTNVRESSLLKEQYQVEQVKEELNELYQAKVDKIGYEAEHYLSDYELPRDYHISVKYD